MVRGLVYTHTHTHHGLGVLISAKEHSWFSGLDIKPHNFFGEASAFKFVPAK